MLELLTTFSLSSALKGWEHVRGRFGGDFNITAEKVPERLAQQDDISPREINETRYVGAHSGISFSISFIFRPCSEARLLRCRGV